MARLPRFTFTPFGNNLAGAPLGTEQFGSAAGGSPNYTNNPATIQALSAWQNGWNSALAAATPAIPPYVPTWNSTATYDIGFTVQASGILYSSLTNGNVGNVPASSPALWQVITMSAGKSLPFLEDVNAVDFVNGQAIGEILQDGIPLWDPGTTYFTNSICQSGGLIYQSLTDANLNNSPSSSPSNWQLSSSTVKGENLFHNAGLIVAQRGNSGTITAGSPAYTVDRWIVEFTGANGTWDINFGAQSNNLTLVGGTGVTDTFIKQRIESLDVSQMVEIGEKFTFQCQILNNTSSPIIPTLAINSPNAAADNYGATATILAATNLQSVPANSTAIVSFTFSIPNNSKIFYGLELILDFGTTLSGATGLSVSNFDFSNTPNLSAGLQSNPPLAQIRPIGIELSNCKRYYQAYPAPGTTAEPIVGVGYMSTTSQAIFQLTYPTMRANPIINFPVAGFFIQGFNGTGYALTGGTIGGFPGPSQAMLLVTGASGFSANVGGLLSWQNSSTGSYSLSAEL